MKNKTDLLTKPMAVALLAVLCCALWGSATPFIKTGYELILPGEMKTTAATILFAGLRFTIAGLLTVIIYSIARRRVLLPKKENAGRILLVSLFQTVLQYIFFYIGLSNTSGVKGTIFSGSNAFFAVLVSALIFRQEKLTVKKIFACILGFAGIIVINLDGLEFNMNFTGDTFVIFSAVASAVSSVLIKKFSKHEDPVIISGYQFIAGGIAMMAVGFSFGGRLKLDTPLAFGVLLYLSVLSAVAYAVWGLLLKHNPVSKVTIYSFMTPVFGVILSWLMLSGEAKIDPLYVIITLLLVCSGIFLINFNLKSFKKPDTVDGMCDKSTACEEKSDAN